jgi:hypothetical protein
MKTEELRLFECNYKMKQLITEFETHLNIVYISPIMNLRTIYF